MPEAPVSPAGPFHDAAEAALRASAALVAAMETGRGKARIYTEVPENAPLPYIVLGGEQVTLERAPCGFEAELFATVHVWSRRSPLDKGAQARAIGALIIAILGAELPLDGWTVDEWELQSEQYITDPDQSTHGIVQLRYLLTQQVA